MRLQLTICQQEPPLQQLLSQYRALISYRILVYFVCSLPEVSTSPLCHTILVSRSALSVEEPANFEKLLQEETEVRIPQRVDGYLGSILLQLSSNMPLLHLPLPQLRPHTLHTIPLLRSRLLPHKADHTHLLHHKQHLPCNNTIPKLRYPSRLLLKSSNTTKPLISRTAHPTSNQLSNSNPFPLKDFQITSSRFHLADSGDKMRKTSLSRNPV